MRNKLILFLTLIVMAGIASTNISHAEDFNFTVPVRLNNLLPTIKSIKIYCSARDRNDIRKDIGKAEKTVNVPDSGNLSTDVNLKFNAWAGADPSLANKYVCYFHLWTPELGYFAGNNISNPEAQIRPNTEFVPQIIGDIQ